MPPCAAAVPCKARPTTSMKAQPSLLSSPIPRAGIARRSVHTGPRRSNQGAPPGSQSPGRCSRGSGERSVEDIVQLRHEQASFVGFEGPSRQRRPPTARQAVPVQTVAVSSQVANGIAVRAGAASLSTAGVLVHSSSAERIAVATPVAPRVESSPKRVPSSSPPRVPSSSPPRVPVRSVSSERTALAAMPVARTSRRAGEGVAVLTSVRSVRESSVRLRAPPCAARTPPVGGAFASREAARGQCARPAQGKVSDRPRSVSGGGSAPAPSTFEPPGRRPARRVGSPQATPPAGVGRIRTPPAGGAFSPSAPVLQRHQVVRSSSASSTGSGLCEISCACLNGTVELLQTTSATSSTTQGASVLGSTNTSLDWIDQPRASLLGSGLNDSIPTLPPTARPILVLPPGNCGDLTVNAVKNEQPPDSSNLDREADRETVVRFASDSSASQSEACVQPMSTGRSVASSSVTTVQGGSPRKRLHDDLELEGPALRADAARCSFPINDSSRADSCASSCDVDQAKSCGDGFCCDHDIRLSREECGTTIIIDDAEGNRLGTFGEECINFELRCKDPRKVERWLQAIETKMLPGLLTLLVDEVHRRTGSANCADTYGRPCWDPKDRSSMVEAHERLRKNLLEATEAKLSNALAG